MKRLYTSLILLLGFVVANSQSNPLYVDANGYVRYTAPKKDTVKITIHDTIKVTKDTIIYKDRIVYRDTTIYKDTCTTQPPPPPPTGIDYLALPLSGAMDLSGKSNVIVENKRFSNINGVTLKLYAGANNITIRNCFFDGASGELVELEDATNITIENCLFARGLAGVYAVGSKGIKIKNCQFVNMRIRRSSTGVFQGRGVFAQFNSCSDIEVLDCKGENFIDESDPEDMISFYASSNGVVRGNMFRGGGRSMSGGGIIIGDTGGDNVLVENNKLLNPGNYILAIAGGTRMTIRNNQGYQERRAWSNVGGYAYSSPSTTGCGGATFTGNNLYCNSERVNGLNHYYFPTNTTEGCSNSNLSGNNSTITIAQLGFPDHLITFVTPEQLLKIRK